MLHETRLRQIIEKEKRRQRALAVCLFLQIVFIVLVLSLASCSVRIPVQVVQYDNEPAITVAPVGTVQISATEAIMNPRVMDPVNVGPLPPKPDPVGPGLDWLSMLLGAGSLAIPALAVAKVLVDRVRTAVAVGTELVTKIQEVKSEHPAAKESINATLAKNQSEEVRKFVDKVKGKDRPKKVQG